MPLFLTIAVVHLVALLSPGPDFFFVSQTAVSRSRRQALFGVLGITLGITVWSALALLGLQLVLHRLAWLQRLIAIAGGRYLLWMGARMLRGACSSEPVAQVERASMPGGDVAVLRAGLLATALSLALGAAVNDSGVALPATAAALLVPLLVALAATSPDGGDVPDGTGGEDAGGVTVGSRGSTLWNT
jgi:threonine/homoserine/homoserine lactone efflux protein